MEQAMTRQNERAGRNTTMEQAMRRQNVRKAILNEINDYYVLQSHRDNELLLMKFSAGIVKRTGIRKRSMLNKFNGTLKLYKGGKNYGIQ